jgi:hypothetical protein
MAHFLTGEALSKEVYSIIFEATKQLLIVSPYIKLDDYLKQAVFDKHKSNSELDVVIAFGKNEQDPKRSLRKDDLDYFKEFSRVTIVYVPALHAKFYANELKGVVTSLNLYDYSLKNNIEFGVVSEKKLIDLRGPSLDDQAWQKSLDILEESYTVFVRRPKYKKKLLLGRDYIGSETKLDLTDQLLRGEKLEKRSFSEFGGIEYSNVNEQDSLLSREEFEKASMEKGIPVLKGSGKLLSGTALGKTKGKSLSEVRLAMSKHDLVIDNQITPTGFKAGITHKSNDKGATWIVYPESLNELL